MVGMNPEKSGNFPIDFKHLRNVTLLIGQRQVNENVDCFSFTIKRTYWVT